jgi:hypothetical protein
MKKSNDLLSLSLAAGSAGVAAFSLANSALLAALPTGVILGAGASLALVAFAIYDYSRPLRPLAAPARLLRPCLPAAAGAGPCAVDHSPKNRRAA